jgi:hypothetical protein
MSEVLDLMLRAERFGKNPKYRDICESMIIAGNGGNSKEVTRLAVKLPTDEILFSNLMEKLKGKSVYTRLRDLAEGRDMCKHDYRVCIASLLTHVLLETKVNPEYEILVEPTLQRLYAAI